MSNTEYAMITLPLFIMLLSLASSAPSTSWPCSQVFDTCPDNGLLMALGPLRSPDFSLVFPDPLLQLPSLTQTSSVSLSAWFQTSCAKNSCLDTPSINITISSSYPNLLSIVYSFVPSSSPTDSTPSLSLCVTYQSCSSNYTIKSRYNVWTLFSVSVQTRITGVAFQVWSNETAITGSVSGLCVNPVQIEPGSKTFMASQSANAQPSIFNLRIFDRAITQSDLTNLIKVVPGPSRFSSYSSMNDWRLPLAVNDSRLQYQNPNSVYGALIASGPIIPTRSVKIATLDRISLSYFWLQFRLRIGYSQPFSSDVAIPIISLHSDSGAFIILWWVKQSSSSNGGTASKVIMVAGLSTTDPVCPNSSGGSTSGEIAISQSSSSFSTINIASIPKEKGPNLQMTVFTDSSSATTQVDLTKMGFSPFTSGAVWSWRPYTQCHMSVPSEPFRLTVESVRLKNESTLASTWNNEKISALDSSDVCTIGSNNDSSLFPGPACSNHGTYTTNTGQCSCNVDRAQPDCRKCASTFQVTPTWLDSYASCTCSVGQQLNSTICTPCVPGYYSNMSNSICKPCDPGQFANLPRAEKCLKCPQGTVSLSGQSVCQTCGPGKFARVSRCLDCQAGTASNMSSSSQCPACAAGKFSNSTGRLACDFCKPGTYIDVTGSTQCVSCAAGTYAQDIAATTCLPCAPGSISSDGQTNCTICNPGKYEQSNKCLDCLPGRFSLGNETGCSLWSAAGSVSSSGSKACTACSAGTFSNVSVCVGCPFGTVSQDSSTICNACTIGSVPNVLQTNCSVCGSGKYQEINNCFSCLPGRFSSSNATSCSLCPLGSVSAGGSKSCTACRPGTWANASACVDCPPGSTSQESSLSCHSCAAGTYTNLNKSLCLPCNPGKYSGPGSIECSSCENGTASGPGQGSCRSCLPGTYSITTDCVTCPNGYYSANAQSVRCDKCLPGTNPDPSRTQCTDCRMGTFSADGGLCSFCPTGRFSNVSKATGCYQCQIGYAAQKGQSSCIKCKPGTAPDRDSELCKACDPGKFSDASSVGVCAPCPPGYYTTDQGQSQCIACSMGRYSNTTGLSTPCFSCTRTSFSDIEGSKECKPCQMHSSVFGNSSVNLQSSAAISQDNCFCDTSFFHNETADSSGFQCDACLAGFVCDTPGTREPLTVKAGYYRDITVDKYLALKCDPEEACLSSTGDTTKCKALYEGYRCSSCIRSLSYRQNQQCRPCGNNALGVTLMVLLFFAFCIVFLAVARPSPAPLTAVGMLLSNIQIIVVFATALTDHWTPEIKTLWQMFSIFNFNLELFRPECALPMDFWTKQQLKLAFPFIAFGFLIAIALVAKLASSIYIRCTGARSDSSEKITTGDADVSSANQQWFSSALNAQVFYASNFVLLYGYTLLVSTSTDPFNCTDAGNGQSFLTRDPSVSCDSVDYPSHLVTSYIFFIIYGLGIPTFFAASLLWHYQRCALSSDKFLKRFGELTSPYNEDYFWWEIVNMIRRLLVILTIDVLRQKFLQLFFTLSILFTSLVLQTFCILIREFHALCEPVTIGNPYRTSEENRLATFWNLITILILFSAAILESGAGYPDTGPSDNEKTMLTAVVFIGFCYTLLYTVRCIFLEVQIKRSIALANRVQGKKLKNLASFTHASLNTDIGDSKLMPVLSESPISRARPITADAPIADARSHLSNYPDSRFNSFQQNQ